MNIKTKDDIKVNKKLATIVKPKTLEKFKDDIPEEPLMSICEIQQKYNLSFPFKVIRIQDSTKHGSKNPLKVGKIYKIKYINDKGLTNNWGIKFYGIIPIPILQNAYYKDYRYIP